MDAACGSPEDEASLRRLERAVEGMPEALLVLGASGCVERANRAATRLLARDREDLLGRTLVELLDLEEQPALAADLADAIDVRGDWASSVPLRRPDGARRVCRVALSPLWDGGRFDGFAVALRDESEHAEREAELREDNRRLAEQAARDPLTGLYNRGYLREALERDAARSRREDVALTVLMADLDGFKAVNDRRGHDLGDHVLREIAEAMLEVVRRGDVVARYGGDEFCLVLPRTAAEAAHAVAERLRHVVQARRFGPDADVALTISIGLAVAPVARDETPMSAPELIRRADVALLEAKRQGGNRVLEFDPYGARTDRRGSAPGGRADPS